MKKRKVLNLCLFAFALFFVFTMFTNAAAAATSKCVLGEQTTKDVKGVLKIFNIVAPLALLGFTIVDAVKAVNSGGTFHFTNDGDMTSQKLTSRFVKRLIGVLLLFILPTLINWLFIFIGIWGEGEGCELSPIKSDTEEVTSDPYGCYSIAGGYAWGKQSEYGSAGMRVNNSNCGRDEYGSQYQCYQCNGNGSLKKWKATSDSDSDCSSGYHVSTGTQAECH